MTRETSAEAYHKIRDEGLLSKRRLEVYTALFSFGPMTASELHRAMHRSTPSQNQNVVTRLGELRDCGVAREVRVRPCSVTGMNVIEWDVTKNLPVVFDKPKKIKCKACGGRGHFVEKQARFDV